MLSESKALNKMEEKKRLRPLPTFERPRTVRLKFRKVGSLQYISHLDLQRTFMRVLVRACIPVWYTKGFNPHAKLVFSTPLSVGAQSEYEFLDLRIDREMSCEEIQMRLNRELTEELQITEAYLPESDFSEIAWASCEIDFLTAGGNADLAREAEKLLKTSPLIMVKKTKSGEKEIDVVSMIHSVCASFCEDTGVVHLETVLKANVGEFLNPEMLVSAMKDYLDILSGDPMEEWYTVLRTGIYREDMTLFR